jgi:hypothetical protein
MHQDKDNQLLSVMMQSVTRKAEKERKKGGVGGGGYTIN